MQVAQGSYTDNEMMKVKIQKEEMQREARMPSLEPSSLLSFLPVKLSSILPSYSVHFYISVRDGRNRSLLYRQDSAVGKTAHHSLLLDAL